MTQSLDLLIGIAQFPNSLDWKKNYQSAISTINYFSKKKVDLVSFQEAFLTGYSPEVISYDFSEIEYYLDLIREHAYKKNICVVIPTFDKMKKRFYSAAYVFNSDNGDVVIYKEGLTPSEKIILHSKKSNRIFYVRNRKVGLLLCREMEDPLYTYFQKKDLPDLLLWPSYWGWEYKMKWGPLKSDGARDSCYQLMEQLRKPLIQINMSSTFMTAPGQDIRKFGKSVFVNPDNRKVGMGAYGKEDLCLIRFDGNRVFKII